MAPFNRGDANVQAWRSPVTGLFCFLDQRYTRTSKSVYEHTRVWAFLIPTPFFSLRYIYGLPRPPCLNNPKSPYP